MEKEITHECSNLRKIILWRKIPCSELSFIALYQKMITQNLESASFTELLKSLLTLGFLKKPAKLGLCFLSEKLWLTQKNSELSFLGTAHKNDNLKLGIFTSKHESTCHNDLRVIVFTYGRKTITRNSEFTWERFPRIPSYRYGP